MPACTVDVSAYCLDGYVRISWSGAGKPVNWYAYRVYGKETDEVEWTLLHETQDNQANYTYDDYLAGSGQEQEWAVVYVTNTAGTLAEETKTPTEDTPICEHYWFIPDLDRPSAVMVEHVTSDTYTEEKEREILLLLDRGRKVETGTSWGVQGTLQMSLRDVTGRTARQQKEELEILSEGIVIWLRNPFGDVWLCSIGDVQYGRVPGVGRQEMITLSVPYTEVASV